MRMFVRGGLAATALLVGLTGCRADLPIHIAGERPAPTATATQPAETPAVPTPTMDPTMEPSVVPTETATPSPVPSDSATPTTQPSAVPTSAAPTSRPSSSAPSRKPVPRPTTPAKPKPVPSNPGAKPAPAPSNSAAAEVLALVNRERAAAGCRPLSLDERLNRAAEGHSADMAQNNYFEHTSLDGRSPFKRMEDAGYPSPGGENIAMGYKTPSDVVKGWMNSSGHRQNILRCDYTTMGLGTANSSRGIYWTQVFGF